MSKFKVYKNFKDPTPVPVKIGANKDFIVTLIDGAPRGDETFFPRGVASQDIAHRALAPYSIMVMAEKVFNFSDPNYDPRKFEKMCAEEPEKAAEMLLRVAAVLGSHFWGAVHIADSIEQAKHTKLRDDAQTGGK